MFFGNNKKYTISRDEKSSIEPEEIFFDAKVKHRSFDGGNLADSKMEVPLTAKNFWIAGFFIVMMFFAIFVYDFNLQILSNEELIIQARNNSLRIKSIKASRGIIYDRNFVPLVLNEPSFDLVAIPKDLPRAGDMDKFLEKLGAIVGMLPDELKLKLKKIDRMSILPVVLKENLDKDYVLSFEAQIGDFNGIKVEKNAIREYKNSSVFSHVLGYTAKISGEELKHKEGYLPTDYIGKAGTEQFYENFMKGENGEYVMHLDARHNILKEGMEKEPKVGNSVVLSIDANLQEKAYELLKKSADKAEQKGALVVINPKNGEILAAVSIPGYDNNLFSRGISQKDYQSLLNNNLNPLFNRTIAGKYPPGSSIKPFIGAAALEENIITPDKKILSTGSISVGSNPETAFIFRDWKEGGHGWVDIFKAIAQSVNTYFYTVGGGYGNIKGLGMERTKKYLQMFGFDAPSGVDMLGEASGFVPTPDWKKDKIGENWFIGDTYNASIGQGFITVTPLELVTAVSAVANGGVLYKPRFAQKIVNSEKEILKEFNPEIIRENFIKGENIDVIRRAMRETVTEGSARSLGELSVAVAGKTGTAQFGSGGKTHAWFSGFAPFKNPEIALVILIEGGGEGSSIAAPIAKEIFQWFIDNKKLTSQ